MRRAGELHVAPGEALLRSDLAGRAIYSRRLGTVEPVFANIQNKGMRRFTLRSRLKVNAQWQLFAIVHNI